MDYCKVTAIIRSRSLEDVEQALERIGVPGITISRVKGYGEYVDYFRRDLMVTHFRVEVFIESARAEEIAGIIMETAHTGYAGDGIVAVIPVAALYRIRTKGPAGMYET